MGSFGEARQPRPLILANRPAVPSTRSAMIQTSSFSGRGRQLVELRRFFDRAVRASFNDLAIDDEPAATYLADLLTRFARTEHLFPSGVALPRLDSVVDMLLEVQAAWQDDTPTFLPERELSVRRHIGDY